MSICSDSGEMLDSRAEGWCIKEPYIDSSRADKLLTSLMSCSESKTFCRSEKMVRISPVIATPSPAGSLSTFSSLSFCMISSFLLDELSMVEVVHSR